MILQEAVNLATACVKAYVNIARYSRIGWERGVGATGKHHLLEEAIHNDVSGAGVFGNPAHSISTSGRCNQQISKE